MNTKHKGDLALSQAISWYMKLGHEVLLPIGDKRPYDLVVEKDGKLHKVQAKFTSSIVPSGNFEVSLRVTGGNQSYYTAKKYKAGDFDLLFVYTERGEMYECPAGIAVDRSSITLSGKYLEYKLN